MTDPKVGPLTHESENDYVWDGEPFWMTFQGTSIRIGRTLSGLRVSTQTFKNGREDEDPYHESQTALWKEES